RTNKGITDDGQSIEVQIAQIEDQLRKCRIASPISGTVLMRFTEAGEFAQTGKPLFTVADMEHIFLRAYITSNQLSKVKIGQRVKVYSDFAADKQHEYSGTVQWVAARGEFTPKTIQTRDERANMVYAVKISVENDGYLKIGMYGEVVL
ncbi:MAG: HlyD family efflux transporter periplasmic adaptor subunit, partial [Rikenellaceae bacterium]